MPPIIPQTCSSTRPQKWVSYPQTCSSTRPQNLILRGCHPFPCRRYFSKTPPKPTSSLPHNPASSNLFDDWLGEAKKGSTGTHSWRWASGLAKWISDSHMTQSVAASTLHMTDTGACLPKLAFRALLSALIFWALIFLELIREEENGGRGTLFEITEGFDTQLKYGTHKKVEIFEWCVVKTVAKQVGCRELGYFKWWVMKIE